jgi:hypothetical protein
LPNSAFLSKVMFQPVRPANTRDFATGYILLGFYMSLDRSERSSHYNYDEIAFFKIHRDISILNYLEVPVKTKF